MIPWIGVFSASAAPITWQGGGPTDFSATSSTSATLANWSLGAISTSSDDVTFDNTVLNYASRNINTTGGINLRSLTFNASPYNLIGSKIGSLQTPNLFSGSFAYLIGSQGGTVFNNTVAPVITQNGAGAIDYQSAINFGTNTAIGFTGNGSGLLRLSTMTTAANAIITKSGTSNILLTGSAGTPATAKWVITGGSVRFTADTNFSVAPGSAVTNFFTLNGGAIRDNNAPTSATTVTLSANRGIVLGDTGTTGKGTIEVGGTNETLAYGGILANNGVGTGGLIKGGKGTLSLTGASTYTGSTEVKAGTLTLGFGTNTTSRINAASNLILSGGSLLLTNSAATASTQVLNGLSVKDSVSTITLTPTGTSITLDTRGAGAALISRSGAGALNFAAINNTSQIVKTANTNTNGSLGGYITVGATDFAKNDGSNNLIALASADYSTTPAANSNFRLDATQNIGVSVTVNSLKTNVATATGNLTFTAGQTLTLASGGILANSTANIGTTAGQGTITSGNGTDLIFTGGNFATTVNAVIGGSGIGVTVNKSAGGTLTLAAANTFSGPLTIHQGTVGIGSTTGLQNVTSIVLGTTGAGAGGGATTQNAVLNFNAAGTNTIAADITLRPANGGQASVNAGVAGQTLNLNGNIAIEAYDPAIDLGSGTIFTQGLKQNTKVTIGGATANAKTISGNSTLNSNFISTFQTNGYGFGGSFGNTLAGGLTNLSNALVINSTIQNGAGGGTLSLRFTSNTFGGANATPGLSLIALNGTNTYTGGGVDTANSSLPPGTVLENTIALLGSGTALGTGPVQFGRNTGAILSNDARAGVLTNAANLTIANNFNIASGSQNSTATQNNVGLGHSMIGGNTATTSTYSGRISFGASNLAVQRGLSYTTDNTFTSTTPFVTGVGYGTSAALVLSQVAGGRTNITGTIAADGFTNSASGNGPTNQVIIASGGEVKLSNANSDYTGRTIVRNGSLLVGANSPSGGTGALGNSTQSVLVGDSRTAFASGGGSVKAATIGALQGGLTFNTTGGTNGNGQINWATGFNAVDIAFDGQTLAVNDFVLIKDQGGSMIAGSSAVANNTSGSLTANTVNHAAVNGIYKVTSTTLTTIGSVNVASSATNSTAVTLSAAAPANLIGTALLGQLVTAVSGTSVTLAGNANAAIGSSTAANYTIAATFERVADGMAYGTYVNVTAGNTWAGTRLYQSYGGPDQAVALNNSPLAFNLDDTSYAPKVLTDGAFTIGRDLTVVGTGNVGTVTLGGNTSDTSAFTGTTTLNKSATLTAAASGIVNFNTTGSNKITGVGGVTKEGAGTVVLGGANDYGGSTLVSTGKLIINGNQSSATGAVTVSSGATLGGSGSVGGATTIQSGGFLATGNSIGTQNFLSGLTIAGTDTVELGTAGATPAAGISDRAVVTGDLVLTGGTLALADNAGANAQGSAEAGAYRLATFTGSRTGTFATVTNPLSATLHEKVVYNGASNGSVDLELYALASAATAGTPVALGKARVGDSGFSTSLTVTNATLANSGFTEGLNATQGAVTGDAIAGGSNVSNLAGASSSTSLTVGLSTATSGAKSGTTAIGFASNGSNSGYADTALAGQTVAVSGAVYDYAAAAFALTVGDGALTGSGLSYTLDFGSGLALSTNYTATIQLANTLLSGFQDALGGAYTATGGSEFSNTSSTFTGLAAGATNSFTITFNTGTSGTFNGNLLFNGNSEQTGLSNAALGGINIAFTGIAVPEPDAAMVVGGLGVLALLRRRRNG